MIRSVLSYLSASRRRWWAHREAQLREEYAQHERTLTDALQQTKERLERELAQVAAMESQCKDRREDLARTSTELREQLRLLEAKASPSHVWAEAFSLGFSKAWDMMLPLMKAGIGKSEQALFDEAVNAALTGLEPTIQQRLVETAQTRLQPTNAVLAKREEFRQKQSSAASDIEKMKYKHYLSAIEWVLGNTNGH